MEKYLDKCLTSLIFDDKGLMAQLEVLVVIDGAKDRSSEIAHKYQDKYPNTFVVIDKKNGNYGSCINRGLKEAKGTYIKVLDADDYFDTNTFNSFLKHINGLNDTVDVIFSGYCVIDENDRCVSSFIRNINKGIILSSSDIMDSVTNGRHVAMHEITYRTEMLRQNGYNQLEGISYTDQEWILYPMAYAKKFYCFDIVLYKYLVGRSGQTMDLSVLKKGIPALISISQKMLEWYSCWDKNIMLNDKYIYSNIIWHLNHLYSICLLTDADGIDLTHLKEFDDYILDINKHIYQELNNLKASFFINARICYVKMWRNGKDKTRMPYMLRIRNRVQHLFYK